MRLSLKKAAHADVSRAAYRKSGGVLGRDSRDEPVPQGRLKITQDEILGYFHLCIGLFAIRGSQARGRPSGTRFGVGVHALHVERKCFAIIRLCRLRKNSPACANEGHGFSRAVNIVMMGEGFTGCGKTPLLGRSGLQPGHPCSKPIGLQALRYVFSSMHLRKFKETRTSGG
jgi:hypothetical protein